VKLPLCILLVSTLCMGGFSCSRAATEPAEVNSNLSNEQLALVLAKDFALGTERRQTRNTADRMGLEPAVAALVRKTSDGATATCPFTKEQRESYLRGWSLVRLTEANDSCHDHYLLRYFSEPRPKGYIGCVLGDWPERLLSLRFGTDGRLDRIDLGPSIGTYCGEVQQPAFTLDQTPQR